MSASRRADSARPRSSLSAIRSASPTCPAAWVRHLAHDFRIGSDGLVLETCPGLRPSGPVRAVARSTRRSPSAPPASPRGTRPPWLRGRHPRPSRSSPRDPATTISRSHSSRFIEGRVDEPVAVPARDPDAGDRTVPRNRGQEEGRRRPEHADDVRVVLLVRGDDETDDLGVVAVVRGKERPKRPVDLPRRDRLLLAGAGFPLDEPAGELAGGRTSSPGIRP